MNEKIFDIETAPDPDAFELIEKLYPFKPEDVSLDPRWKPETCDKKIEEARMAHLPKLLDKTQLDPALGFICSFGLLNMEDDVNKIVLCKNPADEKLALEQFFATIGSRTDLVRLIGWRIMKFDMEFVWRRAWHHRIKPPHRFRSGRYWSGERVIDLMDEWAFNNSQNPWTSLANATKILNCGDPHRPKGVTGKDFWGLISSGDPEDFRKGTQYALSDLVEEKSIAQIIL